MTQLKPSPIPRSRGFSLIELMVVVAIAGILTAIGLPAYRSYVLKSHRTEAKTALLDLAGREERYYNTNNAYTQTQAGLGYGTTGNVTSLSVGSGYYQVSIPATTAATATTAAAYSITATAVGNQIKDTSCASFTVTSLGAQTALNSGGIDDSATCWQ